MKKLNLNVNAFNKGTFLTREQLKKVLGGDVGGSGAPACQEQVSCNWYDGVSTTRGECKAWGFTDSSGHPQIICFCMTPNHQSPSDIASGRESKCNS